MPDHPFKEEIFSDIDLVELEAISSCPITCYSGEETDPYLSSASFH